MALIENYRKPQALNLEALRVDVNTAFFNRKREHLRTTGSTEENLLRTKSQVEQMAGFIRQQRSLGLSADQIMITVGEVTPKLETAYVDDPKDFRTLLRVSWECIYPGQGDSPTAKKVIDDIIAQERPHYEVGRQIKTITPHFAVWFSEDVDTHTIWMHPAILWSGTCSAQQWLDLVSAPDFHTLRETDKLKATILRDALA